MDMEAAMKRIPPHSAEAEQAVLGAMLMNKEAITVASEILSGDDFYQTAYGILFNSMVELFHAGKPVDLITLQEYLKEKDVPPEISSMEFARDLLMGTQTSANIKSYAEIVREKSIMRRLIKVNEETANACYLQNQPLEEILEDAQKQVFALAETGNSEEYVPIKQVVLNALDVIERASKTKGTVTGIPTGFIDLDYKLSGLQRSDLVLIAARPSMGKTAFVLNIAQHVAFRQNKAVAIFSLEMSKEQLVNRLFSLESHVDAQILRTGNLSDTDWEKLIEGAGTIGSSRMIIDDTSGITISEMRSKCRKYKLEMGLDLIIIDYLQLMSGSNSRKNESRQQEISEISRSLKGLARELNVPVLALSQLSRAVEQRTDKRPMLSDLRESGAIEQDADVCMFIYRDDYYNPDTEDKNIAEIIIVNRETARSVQCVLRGCHSTLVLETSCVSRIRRYKKEKDRHLLERACPFSVYKSNKSTGMCSMQLEIAEMLCKSFFESQYRTILHTFSSGRLLLANQAVQFTEMFFFLPFFCLEKKIHLTYDICGDLSADFFF